MRRAFSAFAMRVGWVWPSRRLRHSVGSRAPRRKASPNIRCLRTRIATVVKILSNYGSSPALPGRQQKFDILRSPSTRLRIVSRQAHEGESSMDDYESLSHSKWECKYHVVFIPKCRRKTLYAELRRHLGEVFRRLAEQKESRIEEGHLLAGLDPRDPLPYAGRGRQARTEKMCHTRHNAWEETWCPTLCRRAGRPARCR